MPYSFLFCKKSLLKIFNRINITSINQEIKQCKNNTNVFILFKRFKNMRHNTFQQKLQLVFNPFPWKYYYIIIDL